MNGNHATATAEKVMVEETESTPSPVFDDGLPPPTHAQIAYWRQLCGVMSQVKGHGMTDEAWPADLAPTSATLKALTDRRVIVRRGRAWHLKRDWYRRICALRARAVPTAYQTLAERPRADLPSYAELEGFEQICRWLDAQSRRRARLPFVGLREQLGAESEVPIALLHLMRKYRIARHTTTCEWALSPTWKDRLRALWDGVDREVREQFPVQPTPSDPYVVAAGIDTWYLNRIDYAGLPSTLRHELDEIQTRASEDEEEVDTRWVYDGVPLRMYQAGVSAKQGGGVSWAYILRNNSLALLIRRAPLGGIVAQARLGSECLWRLTPRRALDEVDLLIRRMWARPIPFRQKGGKHGKHDEAARWQVSQIHLAVDVANAPLALEQASRYVSRSRSRAIYEAAKSEIEQLMRAIHGPEAEDMDALVLDWDGLYEDDSFSDFDPFDDLAPESAREKEPTPVGERAVTIHGFGKRISGMTFSPGGDVSMVMYDKVLQARLAGKRHMEPIWAAAGWQAGVSVTRNEVRIRRRAMRELGLPNDVRSCLDDPWECLTHQKDLFNAVVGRSDACPDATDVAWIRRVIPDAEDTNQSRWPTDPVWRVIQSGTFAEAPAGARRMIRRRQRGAEVVKLDEVQFGCLISRTAKLHPEGGQWTLSRALGEVSGSLETIEAKKTLVGKDFGELVRERRRQFGLPLPIADKVLPFRSIDSVDAALAGSAPILGGSVSDAFLDAHDVPGSNAMPSDLQPWRLILAEERIADAWIQLQAAEQAGHSRWALDSLEEAYYAELATYTHLTSRVRDLS